MKFSWIFSSQNFFKHFSPNAKANWTYRQNIENCDTPTLSVQLVIKKMAFLCRFLD